MLSQEDAAYLSGILERGGLGVFYRKGHSVQIAIQLRLTDELAQIVNQLIGNEGGRTSEMQSTKITPCNSKKSYFATQKPQTRWYNQALVAILPQLKFKTAKMEAKRLEAVSIINEGKYFR